MKVIKMPKLIDTPPNASNEIKMLSKIGYTLESAISDIIDNSITAKCKNIHIYSLPSANPTWSIVDDGIGMTPKELCENMRLGCKDPAKERELMDLGRFGSGMKTASISQANRVTVFSKSKKHKISGASWDVERISKTKKWMLEVLSSNECMDFEDLEHKIIKVSGTQVHWQNLTRYTDDDHKDIESLQASDIVSVKSHIATHFHKFLEGKNKIKISVNGDEISPINPFMSGAGFDGYEVGPEKLLYSRNGSEISIRAHTIPHWSKLTKAQIEIYGGQTEIRKKQGLYVYRANRLIIDGGWMGLTNSSNLSDLARIEINVPVSVDEEWQTDVKKSSLQLPPLIKAKLRNLIKLPKKKSRRRYKYRGTKEEENPYWARIENDRENTVSYEISNENNELKKLLKKLNKNEKSLLGAYLKKLSYYLPIASIYYQMSEKPLDLDQEEIERKYKSGEDIFKKRD